DTWVASTANGPGGSSRSAFSVALTDDKMSSCHGPFPDDSVITYKRVFLNLGDSYDMQTGRFTAPRSGVYSLAVTMYGAVTAGKMATCTQLQVNNREVTTLLERNGQDTQDSASVVVALRLKAGDQVAVKLLKGCSVCDSNNHYNTFTGFLLYATDAQSPDRCVPSRVAFTVTLFKDVIFMCFGPFSQDSVIIYQNVVLNLGGGYSTDTGVFTVPRSGVYSIALTVFSDAGSPNRPLAVCATLKVNGEPMFRASEQNRQDQEDSATIAVALHLTAGDQVAVYLPSGCFLCEFSSHFNTFSAFLSLWPDLHGCCQHESVKQKE
uniref:C1q domain-containing protein n=1 Tax=Echeneis naucrates TaxID=173247 RepID=A0A665V504_ECHNA